MPTRREREYYRMGFKDGMRAVEIEQQKVGAYREVEYINSKPRIKKRKLSAWNKYVKNKRNHITYRDGKLNLKKMAVAFRRKKRR